MYIILAAVLITIAAYYPIKLIKFYCVESFEQGLKAKITQDLREGKVSRNLILSTLVRVVCVSHVTSWALFSNGWFRIRTRGEFTRTQTKR